MKFLFTIISALLAVQGFAQHDDHSHEMNMEMDGSKYLPAVITHAIIKSWGHSNLFKTKLDTSTLVYLNGEQEHTITIKAFQQQYYDDPNVLKPVWVLGYVSDEAKQPACLPGPVIESEYAHPTKIFWVNKIFETLQGQPGYQLYPVYDSQKNNPYVPIVYNVNDPLHVPMIADALYPDFKMFPNGVDPMHEKVMDMSTYYSATVHLHGGNVTWQNDGYPTSKYYPVPGAAPVKITWGLFGKFEENKTGQHYVYPNVFPEAAFSKLKSKTENTPFVLDDNTKYEGHHSATLWYHDHGMMRTATDVYTGQAGAFIVKGVEEKVFSSLVHYKHDIPLLLEDKSFTQSGYLYYNTTTTLVGPKLNTEEESGQPEFFANTITVNGKIWPYMNVESALYRFRLINASNSRFYRFAIAKWKDGKIDTGNNALLSKNFIQVGTGGGFFPDGKFPHIGNDNSALTLAPGERADVLINFSAFEPGTSLVMLNYAPDGPYGDDELTPMNADGSFDDLTNYVMLFRIDTNTVASPVRDADLNHALISFAASPVYKKATASQYLYSYYKNDDRFKTELKNALVADFDSGTDDRQLKNKRALSSIFPRESRLLDNAVPYRLTINEAANYTELPMVYKKFVEANPMLKRDLSFPMAFLNETEWNVEAHTPTPGNQYEKTVNNYATEIWAIWNNTGDTHPIHLHLNRFRILGRQAVDDAGKPLPGVKKFILPEPNEMGWKDVVRTKPGYINYILVQFVLNDPTQEGQFVYHCHILEHEDMSMMRRLVIKPVVAGPKFALSSH
jgi:FtsP/CotA-like multicopper oxidase with cupredoxin domain